ncbi:hypothetical protein [Nitrosomonas sp.]|uniref:hypothetical protein n=1 Tax=Nitrosomonas sp. TaxID=42353 RepID=UPI002086F01E|nr:hypothetical protein [Nitrosomonas sp.]GJL76744.1 MAG: hypothetical protein NMNS02_28500 [Nitrosomonas sp.]
MPLIKLVIKQIVADTSPSNQHVNVSFSDIPKKYRTAESWKKMKTGRFSKKQISQRAKRIDHT